MKNLKPYRTKALKAMAKAKAVKCRDGAFRVPTDDRNRPVVPVLHHGGKNV